MACKQRKIRAVKEARVVTRAPSAAAAVVVVEVEAMAWWVPVVQHSSHSQGMPCTRS